MFSIDTRVYPSACDKEGRMKLYSVMQQMQDCSELWLSSEPVFSKYFADNGMAQLLAYRQIDILRVPTYAERLSVRTSVYEVNALFGHRNTSIYDNNGNLCYKSWSMGAFVNRQTGKLQKVPQEVYNSVGFDSQVDMDYTERRIVLPEVEPQRTGKVIVQATDIDYNGHVNNAEYMRMALNLLPEGFNVSRVRIEYKVPAKMGDTIETSVLDCGTDFYVVLRINEHISTIFQFTTTNSKAV